MKSCGGIVVLFLLFVVVAIIAAGKSSDTGQTPRAAVSTPAPAPVLPQPIDAFSISKANWKVGGFGTVAVFNFTFQNDNDYPVKDPEVTCTFFAASGTTLSTGTKTVYEAFKAKSSRTIRDFNFGFMHSQAKSASCRATGVSR